MAWGNNNMGAHNGDGTGAAAPEEEVNWRVGTVSVVFIGAYAHSYIPPVHPVA